MTPEEARLRLYRALRDPARGEPAKVAIDLIEALADEDVLLALLGNANGYGHDHFTGVPRVLLWAATEARTKGVR
jgi:hypothetical protein